MTTVLVEYQPHVAAITALQEKYRDVVYDVATPTGYTGALGESKEFKKLFNQIDKVRSEIKKPALELCRQIDEQAKQFSAPLKSRFTELENALAIEDEKNAIRIAAIESRIESIKALPMQLLGKTSEYMHDKKQEIMGLNPNDFEEFNHVAKKAIDECLAQLEIAHKQREQQDALNAQQQEIERQKREIQAEQARIDKVKADQELEQRLAVEREQAAANALAKAESERVEREKCEREAKLKADALRPEQDVIVAWLESIVESAPTVRDESLSNLVRSVINASNKHITALKQ